MNRPSSSSGSKDPYVSLTPLQHVRMRPATYIGSHIAATFDQTYVYHEERIRRVTLTYIEGVVKIFEELLSNVYDNVVRSLAQAVDPGTVEVIIHDHTTITVTNEGLPIHLYQTSEGMWSPQLIFGTLLSGSNFHDQCTGGGTNGIGAKATNIFSSQFTVTCYDPLRQLAYSQQWQNGMTVCSNPVVQSYPGTAARTSLTYTLDLPYFQAANPSFGGYDDGYLALFLRHLADLSATARIIVTVTLPPVAPSVAPAVAPAAAPAASRTITFDFRNPLEYAKLFITSQHPIVHYQWPSGITPRKSKSLGEHSTVLPDVALVLLDAPGEGGCHSFVNGLNTRDGGIHVNEAYKSIGSAIVTQCNDEVIRLLEKTKSDTKEVKACTVDLTDVKANVFLLLIVRLMNPKYTNQTKTRVNGPAITITLPPSALLIAKKWRLQDQLFLKMQEKQHQVLAKQDKKRKGSRMLHAKGTDANWANHKNVANRHQCTLAVAEGDSAVCYLLELIGHMGGRDKMGFLPLKGKSLNVRGLGALAVEKNVEMAALRRMLGLQFDTDYSRDSNLTHLRYGSLLIVSDADVDGIHIAGLIVNFFHCFFPGLLQRGFVKYWRTPVIRVKGTVTYHTGTTETIHRKFYHLPPFEAWLNSVAKISPSAIHYYKGLGSSEKKDILEDYRDPKIAIYHPDPESDTSMNLAFNDQWADQRKEWIAAFTHRIHPVDPQEMVPACAYLPLTTFINEEFILFSIENMRRSLPQLMDGMKESIRKVMFGCLQRFKSTTGSLKVATLNAYIMELTRYHHGDNILTKVIVSLAQSFVGSNNINWLLPLGMFGNRFNPKAASPRYIFTNLNPLTLAVLHPDDKGILSYINEEGDDVEPVSYYPVIPFLLVNKCVGIGSGHSTTIPPFNPLDLVQWIRCKLRGESLPLLLPWYRNYRGIVTVIDRITKQRFRCDYLNSDGITTVVTAVEPFDDGKTTKMTLLTEGRIFVDQSRLVITELPVDTVPSKYEKFLDELIAAGTITTYHANSLDDTVHITIEGYAITAETTYQQLLDTFQLTSSNGMSNLTVLRDGHPYTYHTPHDLMEQWFADRLPHYERRKDHLLHGLAERIDILSQKQRLIHAIREETFEMKRAARDPQYVTTELARLAVTLPVFESIKVVDATDKNWESLLAHHQELVSSHTTISHTSLSEMWERDLSSFEERYRTFLTLRPSKDDIPVERTRRRR